MYLCEYHVCTRDGEGRKRELDSWRWSEMWAVSCAVWVLGTKPSSGRAEVPLHQRAISSPTISPFSSSFFSVKFFLLRLLLHQK